ncbi:MAG TPA: hypothetical protein DHW02_14180 [Ktedonobacter sp.]|nr:hypothetical protein [Ktedonobacter sp.]
MDIENDEKQSWMGKGCNELDPYISALIERGCVGNGTNPNIMDIYYPMAGIIHYIPFFILTCPSLLSHVRA